jgi:hypothetical protein
MRRVTARLLVVLLLLLPPLVAEAAAQVVVLEGPVDTRAARILRDVLERDRYLLLHRDTTLPEAFHTPGDLIVWDARVRLEGSVDGAAVVLGGTFFTRPGSRVGGPIAVIGGLALTSELADVGDVVELPPGRAGVIVYAADTLTVSVPPPPPVPRLGLGGLFGFRQLGYDRVDGLSVSWGPQWRIVGREFGPRVDGWVTLRSARADVGGGGVLRLPLGAGVELDAGAERATVSNEVWIRRDLENSASALLLGRDLRDYYETDRGWLRLSRLIPQAVLEGDLQLGPYLMVRRSTDRSLEASRPFAFATRAQLERANLPVEHASTTSLEAGTLLVWRGRASRFLGQALAEYAPERADDLHFSHWRLGGRYEMDALWNHLLDVRWHAMGSFGDRAAPPQRWSFVGGQGTLPTFPIAQHRGDRLVFIESRYRVPLTFLETPLLRTPYLELLHATGTAWRTGTDMPAWDQNLGLGLEAGFLRLRAWIDPAIARPRTTLLLELSAR